MSFDSAFEKTVGLEGGYCNDPRDPGGETKYGISHRAYPDLDIKNLTLEDAKLLYYRDYWIPMKLGNLVDPTIAEEIFDTGVNMGTGAAVQICQRAINFLSAETIEVDGVMGPITIDKLNQWSRLDAQALFRALNGYQFMRYVDIVKARGDHVFARGWMKRISDYRQG